MEMEKSNKGLKIALVLFVILFLGASGYIVYDKFFTKEEVKKEEIKEVEKITEEEATAILNNIPNGYESAAANILEVKQKGIYIGEEVTIDTISDSVLLETAYNEYIKNNKITKKDKSMKFSYPTYLVGGYEEEEETDDDAITTNKYFETSLLTDIIKKNYNKEVKANGFYVNGNSWVLCENGYFTVQEYPGGGSNPVQKKNQMLTYEIKDGILTIEEKVVLYREGTEYHNGKYEVLNNLYDVDPKAINKTNEAIENELNTNGVTYKHEFKKINGSWYWNKTNKKD